MDSNGRQTNSDLSLTPFTKDYEYNNCKNKQKRDDTMIIDKISTQKEDIVLTGITLLSKEEYLEHKDKITGVHNHWWLRSPGIDYFSHATNDYFAAFVFGVDGHVDERGYDVDEALCVRPALCIGDLKSLQVGDKFKLAKQRWTIISDKYALCDNIIGKSAFSKKDWYTDYGNYLCYDKKGLSDYETSDVKQYVESWAKKNGIEFDKELDKELDDNLENDLEG